MSAIKRNSAHPAAPAPPITDIDAIVLVSFGGPEKPDDVVPFLENVTRGRGIPRERLVEVGEHYFGFGGRSPINDQNRALLAAIQSDLADSGSDLPVYWGNRNWSPYLRETFEQMARDGVRHAACFITSAYSSYSSCRQYSEDLHAATDGLPIEVSRISNYALDPGFLTPFVEATRAALDEAPDGTHVVFVTHSIPTDMNDASGCTGRVEGGAYVAQHEAVARHVVAAVGSPPWSLAYCSRSGAPHIPWLEPDINDHLAELVASGVTSVVLVPIGFVSDHMEVVYDLDTEAAQTAADLGLRFARVPTPGTHHEFVQMVRRRVENRDFSHCAPDCCVNPRSDRPVIA